MNFDRGIGLSYVCERWHSDRWSRGYRILCKLHIHHGSRDASYLLPRHEWEAARRWAAHYMRLARTHPRMF